MRCRQCDKDISEGMKFCPFCGTELDPTDYCVIVLECEKSDFQLIKIIHDKLGLDLSQSTKLAKRLPFTMYSDLHENEANEIVLKLEADGITAIVDRTPAEQQEKPASAVEQKPQNAPQPPKNDSSNEIVNFAEKKKILFRASVLNATAAIVTALVTLFILILPMFTVYSIDSNEETNATSESLLTVVIDAAESVIRDISNTDRSFLGWMYLALKISLAVSAVMLIITAVKNAVARIKILINFEQYSAKELTVKSILKFTPKAKNDMIYKTGFELALTAFVLGYRGIIWSTLIIIASVAVVGFVTEKIGESQKKKALKID